MTESLGTDAHCPETAVYPVVGALDLAAAAQVMEGLTIVIGRGPSAIDIDLSSLSYIDSVGLSVFVTAHYQCLDAGVRLRFLNPSPLISRLLQANGLDEILQLVTVEALVGA